MRTKKRKKGDLADILTKDFLYREHYENKKSLNQISKEVKCDRGSVVYYLNIYKLPVQIHDIYHPFLKDHPGWKGCGDISMSYWKNLKGGARNRKIPFSIKIEEAWNLYLSQNRKCSLSGIEIGFENPKVNTASLDRINSKEGYKLGNIQWIHKDINRMKSDFEQNHFIGICQKITQYKNESK